MRRLLERCLRLIALLPLSFVVDPSVGKILLPRLRGLNERRSQLTRAINELEVAQWCIVAVTTTHVHHAGETRRTVAEHKEQRRQQKHNNQCTKSSTS